jgi:hypothetical protein
MKVAIVRKMKNYTKIMHAFCIYAMFIHSEVTFYTENDKCEIISFFLMRHKRRFVTAEKTNISVWFA